MNLEKEDETIHKLRQRITELEAERNTWKQERTVQRIVEIPPADYKDIQNKYLETSKRAKDLETRCKTMENLLQYGGLSMATQLVKEYQSVSKSYLERLSKEIAIFRVSKEDRAAMIGFLDYLHLITHDIEELLLLEKSPS